MEKKPFTDALKEFTGTKKYHKHGPRNFQYLYLTDGCQFAMAEGRLFWLFNLITYLQGSKFLWKVYFQVWSLQHVSGVTWLISCADGNGKLIYSDDFYEGVNVVVPITIWVDRGVAMLPSEHKPKKS